MASKPSKFIGIFGAAQEPPAEVTQVVLVETEAPPASPAGRRASGKKSDPRYKQVTAYVRKDLYRTVTDALYDDARGRDTKRQEFSELVDELLERWCQERERRKDRAE